MPTSPNRTILQAEAIGWLLQQGRLPGASVVTSLPDVLEIPDLDFPGWQRWFEHAAAVVMGAVPDEGVAIFFQSDIRYGGLWVDKGAMVSRGAERAGGRLLFHRIVCRHKAGTLTAGRASYSHLLGFAHKPFPASGLPRADVIPDAGWVPGKKGMGIHACVEACRFILRETPTRLVVDPFCGWGTAVAVGNALGMEGIGVDLSPRMCRRARLLDVTDRI
jgi:hypothetical protein